MMEAQRMRQEEAAHEGYHTTVYRAMGDAEEQYLFQCVQLPSTHPSAINEGLLVRAHVEKFLRGQRKVATWSTTVVELCVPKSLLDTVMSMQHKVEDATSSMVLENKVDGGISILNTALETLPLLIESC
jgi:hypothetical protein